MFFDDALRGRSLDANVVYGLLSPEEATALQPFFDLFSKFIEDHRGRNEFTDDFVNTDRWKEVASLAGKTFALIGKSLRS